MPLSLFHLHGDLKDLRFPRLLAALREDDFTGVFQATVRPAGASSPADGGSGGAPPAGGDGEEITREVHFSAGHIAWAISTDRDESLRAYLLRNGTVTEDRWAEAEEAARDGTLRQSLIDLGIVNARELTQIEKGRAEEIVLSLFSAREGEYRVRERQLSPGTPDLKIDARPLILKGVMEGGDRSLILDEVGSLDTVYVVKRPALEEPGLSLPGEFQSVLRHVDGKRSIAQVCSLTSMPDYFVCSVFAALSMVGAVRRNYEKTHGRGRGEIVKGIEVAAPAAPAAPAGTQLAAPPPAALPAAPVVTPPAASPAAPPAAPMAETEAGPEPEPEMESETEPELELDLDLEPVASGPPVPVEPARASAPAGLPPITRRAAAAPAAPAAPAPSVYSDNGPPDSSRPWFLLGGAAAVGAAALFLILMAQNPGDAGEVVRPVAEAAPQPSETAASPAPAADAGGATPLRPQAAGNPAVPETPDFTETNDRPDTAVPAPPPAAIATPPGSNILKKAPGGDRAGSRSGNGRESLLAGDYVSAARQFGKEVTGRSGQFTIQLLTACQDETLRRAVDSSRGAADLFILSARVDGRNCYRVFWGRYPSATRAREALRRDIPSTFSQDRNQPRVTRIGG